MQRWTIEIFNIQRLNHSGAAARPRFSIKDTSSPCSRLRVRESTKLSFSLLSVYRSVMRDEKPAGVSARRDLKSYFALDPAKGERKRERTATAIIQWIPQRVQS